MQLETQLKCLLEITKRISKTGVKVVSGRDVINSVGKNNLPTEIEQKNGYKLITIGERSAKIANGRNTMLTKIRLFALA